MESKSMIALTTQENLLLAWHFNLDNDIRVMLLKQSMSRNFQGISLDLETLQELDFNLKRGIVEGVKKAIESDRYLALYPATEYLTDLISYGYNIVKSGLILGSHYPGDKVNQAVQTVFYHLM